MASNDERSPLLGSGEHEDAFVHTPAVRRTSKLRRLGEYLTSNRFLLYVCCFITSWGDRMWMFAIGVYMIALYPSSLELTAIYGFINSGCSLLFGAIIGDMIDQSQRLKAVRVALLVRNLSIFSCSAAVFVTFMLWDEIYGTYWFEVSKVGIIFFAVLAHLASMANNLTVTKDWVVVICGTNKESLMEMSAFFRRIDLVCKLLSPIVVGQIMSYASNSASAIFICCESIVTLIVMYAILRVVYRRVPRLAIKEDSGEVANVESEETEPSEVNQRGRCISQLCFSCISFGKGWSCYIRQPVAAAGFSLAMMFMTVLGFDNITVGYAYSQGLSPSILSWIMAASAITGIIGTLLFQPLRKCCGLIVTGVIAFIVDLAFLAPCVWSVFAPGTAFLKWPPINETNIIVHNNSDSLTKTSFSLDDFDIVTYSGNGTSSNNSTDTDVNVSLILLMSGIVMSRIGLWLVDLVVTQLILETVSEKKRGKVNGVQFSLNMFLDLLKFLLVILVPQPQYFGFLIIASVAFIFFGFVIFFGYGCYNRCKDPISLDSENDALLAEKDLDSEDNENYQSTAIRS